MRIKTMLIILVTILLTVILMQNTEPVYFNFLWATFRLSKLVMMAAIALVAFILGILVGRPKRIRKLGDDFPEHEEPESKSGTLSDEDRDYIS